MNPVIEKQLRKVKIAELPDYDENTTTLLIKKRGSPTNTPFIANHYYLIELEDYIIHPSPTFTLHTNWNKGLVPTEKCYKCLCTKVMGKMVQIQGVGFDYDNRQDLDAEWDGWLPIKSVKILREI